MSQPKAAGICILDVVAHKVEIYIESDTVYNVEHCIESSETLFFIHLARWSLEMLNNKVNIKNIVEKLPWKYYSITVIRSMDKNGDGDQLTYTMHTVDCTHKNAHKE